MAGIGAAVRAAVAAAKAAVGGDDGVLVTVTQRVTLTRRADGKPLTWSDTPRVGFLRASYQYIQTQGGTQRQARHTITFLEDFAIDPDDDTFIIPEETGPRPILDLRGPADPHGGHFLKRVWLG